MKRVEIFTDGACKGNPGPGGWGALLRMGPHEKELSGGEEGSVDGVNWKPLAQIPAFADVIQKAMAQALEQRDAVFELHYAGRVRSEMAFRDRLERQLGDKLRVYSGADGERLDIQALLVAAPQDAVFYVCGPTRLVNALREAARKLGFPRNRIRLELFG